MEDSSYIKDVAKALEAREYSKVKLAKLSDYSKSLNTTKKEILLQTLDYTKHSAIVLTLLNDTKCAEPIFFITKFLRELNVEQIHALSGFKQLCQVVNNFNESFLENKVAVKLTKALFVALEKIIAHDKGLTMFHTIYVKHCLQTKNYKATLPIIEKPVMNIAKSFEMEERDYLNYFFYSAYAFTALERYDDAVKILTLAIQISGREGRDFNQAINEIRNKLTLLLLRKGFSQKIVNKLTQFAPSQQSFLMDSDSTGALTSAYKKLSEPEIFANAVNFEKFLQENHQTLSDDRNLGLTKIIKDGIYWKKLKELRSTYSQYKISDLYKYLDLPESFDLRSLIIRVMKVKPIAKIDCQKNTISFEKSHDPYKIELLRRLHTNNSMIRELALQYDVEHLGIIRDRIAMPNTIFS